MTDREPKKQNIERKKERRKKIDERNWQKNNKNDLQYFEWRRNTDKRKKLRVN